MSANRRISRLLDQHRFDAVSATLAPATAAVMLLDSDLRIRGVNPIYETISMRPRDDLLGELVSDAFPDDPAHPHASGSSQLAMSVENAMSRRGTHSMPIFRYDITAPQDPDIFLPKLWTCENVAIHDDDGQLGVLHQVSEITSLNDALAALSHGISSDELQEKAVYLHVLAALATMARDDQARVQAMAREIEQLQRAVESRDIIGQAKGMLMERFDVDAAAAFDLLSKLSQGSNTRLADVARKLVELDHPGAH
jgi:antirestriction protein